MGRPSRKVFATDESRKSLTGKIPVRIDSKTVIYVKPTSTKKYIKSIEDKFKELSFEVQQSKILKTRNI